MKQVFTNENSLLAINSKNVLESAGIAVELKNEFTAGSAVPGHAIWLEIWVDDSDYETAISLLDTTTDDEAGDWVCAKCNEQNSASFKICWNCQVENV
jgi:hypothetical protein